MACDWVGFVCSVRLSTLASSAENTQQIGCIPDILKNKGPFAFMGSKGLVTLRSLPGGPAREPELETTRANFFDIHISFTVTLRFIFGHKDLEASIYDYFLFLRILLGLFTYLFIFTIFVG